ncbi:MAG: DUF1287 domain-containing protein [Candidatus Paceibacterota bacterium]|jgi:hypothetical protein
MKTKFLIAAIILTAAGAVFFLWLGKPDSPLAERIAPVWQTLEQGTGTIIGEDIKYSPSHPLVEAAKKQIGVVTKYDTSYYPDGYPPTDRGACTDVIARALKTNGYDLKEKIDADMAEYPDKYPNASDPNINFRRVTNVKIFLDNHAQKLSTCITSECFAQGLWQAGDIVTFDQIPESLWHIAIVSNKTKKNNNLGGAMVPFLVHNHGGGTVEDNMLLTWPTPITGHYRTSSWNLESRI